MTDDQFNQLFGLVTKCVTGVQRLEEKVDKLDQKVDKLDGRVAKLEEGQAKLEAGQIKIEERMGKIENKMKILSKTVSIAFNEAMNNRARLEIIEEERQPAN